MFSSAFLLFGLAVISQYVPAVQSVPASHLQFETESANANEIPSQNILQNPSTGIYFCSEGRVNSSVPVVHSDSVSQIHFERVSVKVNEIPYQIILQNVTSGKYFCGGVLINSFNILTAAQCVYRRNISEIIVHAGAIKLGEEYSRTKRAVSEIFVHEQYDPQKPWCNDIAFLELAMEIVEWERTKALPIGLIYEQNTQRDDGEPGTVSGYGITSESQEPSFQRLMKHNTYVFPRVDCEYLYSINQYNISETQICAFDSCNPTISEKRISDIGGPLIINGELAGIASSSFTRFPIDVLYRPTVFTNISLYREWIWIRILMGIYNSSNN